MSQIKAIALLDTYLLTETQANEYEEVRGDTIDNGDLVVTSFPTFMGYPLTITHPISGTVGYSYDAEGNRTGLSYPDGKQVEYTYDSLGRLVEVEDWDSGTTTYAYDVASRLVSLSRPNSVDSSYEYDNGSRLESLAHSDSSDMLASFEYSYDAAGNRSQVVEILSEESEPAEDLIFSDGFESGDFSAWSGSKTDGGDLSVTTQAAMEGSYGMQALIDDNKTIYVRDDSPNAETLYRASFEFDLNSITMATNDSHGIFVIFRPDGDKLKSVANIVYRYDGSNYQMRVGVWDDSDSVSLTSQETISDTQHLIEIEWWAASSAGADDGGLKFWIDEELVDEIEDLDNDTHTIESVRLGAVIGIDAGTSGTLYFDDFSSYNSSFGERMASGGGGPSSEELEEKPEEIWEEFKEIVEVKWEEWENSSTSMSSGGGAMASRSTITTTTTITYTYDDVYRLTDADYSDGEYFDYTYDTVGNRLTKETTGGLETEYLYDNANRLTSVDSTSYTWDDNGNLLSDGVYTYTYSVANHLNEISNGSTTIDYDYNGLGDRVLQVTDGVTTTYALDIAAGLTQVLVDNDHAYLYGVGRISQHGASTTEYFLEDALGSVRQLVDGTGEVTLTQSYQPYGEVLSSEGDGTSMYAFTGEVYDSTTKLVYLRARYYAPTQGRFLSRDIWDGIYSRPHSLNKWNYVESNPINYIDPVGLFPVWCQNMPSKALFELCVITATGGIFPIDIASLGDDIEGFRGCYNGNINYRAIGYLEGLGSNVGPLWTGLEQVYSFATMERAQFSYAGIGISDSIIGVGLMDYGGYIIGLPSNTSLALGYLGASETQSIGVGTDLGIPVGASLGISGFRSYDDPSLFGYTWYVGGSISADLFPILELSHGLLLNYVPYVGSDKPYAEDGVVNRTEMLIDIMLGQNSPWILPVNHYSVVSRSVVMVLALRYANIYEDLKQF